MFKPSNFLAVLFFLPVFLLGQEAPSIYRTVDSLTLKFSEQQAQSPEDVIRFVNTTFNTDSSKVRAYYRWIAYNVEYDVDLMKAMAAGEDTDNNTQHPDTAFKKRLAVCEGYAKLMKKFCEGSDILCEVVPGYSKSDEDERVMDLYHAWNAVRIQDDWHLLDVTWSNNYIDDEGEYMKEFTGRYFLEAPERFVKDHLPLDPMWQLLETPVTKNGFFENTGEHIPGYSYKDSLAAYIRESATNKHFIDVMHYHLYDPENIRFARSIDVIHNNIAANYLLDATSSYLDYVNFFTNEFSKNVSYKDCGKAKSMLSESKLNLTRTLNYLEDKTAFTEEFSKNFNEIRNTAKSNLEMVNRSLEILGRFQKKLVVASRNK